MPTRSCPVWLCATGSCNTNLTLPIIPHQLATELPTPGSRKVKTQILSDTPGESPVCRQVSLKDLPLSEEPCPIAPLPENRGQKIPPWHLPFSHFSEGTSVLEKGLEMRQREREVSSGIANRTGNPEGPGVAVSRGGRPAGSPMPCVCQTRRAGCQTQTARAERSGLPGVGTDCFRTDGFSSAMEINS